jgi:hypothetical protein
MPPNTDAVDMNRRRDSLEDMELQIPRETVAVPPFSPNCDLNPNSVHTRWHYYISEKMSGESSKRDQSQQPIIRQRVGGGSPGQDPTLVEVVWHLDALFDDKIAPFSFC